MNLGKDEREELTSLQRKRAAPVAQVRRAESHGFEYKRNGTLSRQAVSL